VSRSFAVDTAVERIQQGSYAAAIAPGWDIGGNANGGYLLAIAARAIALETGRPDPVTITAHYLSPGRPGPLSAEVRAVKQGKRFGVATAALYCASQPVLQALGTFGDLGQAETGVQRIEAQPPDLPPADECVRHSVEHGAPAMYQGLDLRLHPEDAGFRHGEPSGELRVRGWFRFADAGSVDTLGLLLAVDAFPPTSFNARLPVAWTPTIELTTHVRARPVPGWLRATFSSRFVSGGFVEEDGEIWDASGRLVAQSRQLALLPLAVAEKS
jgi:acyl-CoA thioesterase